MTIVADLAGRHKPTAYGAACPARALGMSLPVATLDRALAAAARSSDVTLLGSLAP